MLLSRASHYAISAVLRLSALQSTRYCRVETLLQGTAAPRAGVAKVLQELARRGILESSRGSTGGFRLAPAAANATLMDIVEAVDGPWELEALGERGLCLHDQPCPLAQLLQPISNDLEHLLRSTRIAELASNCNINTCCAPGAREPAAQPKRQVIAFSGEEP